MEGRPTSGLPNNATSSPIRAPERNVAETVDLASLTSKARSLAASRASREFAARLQIGAASDQFRAQLRYL